MMIYGVLIYWSWNNELLRVWRYNKRKKMKLFVDFVDGEGNGVSGDNDDVKED